MGQPEIGKIISYKGCMRKRIAGPACAGMSAGMRPWICRSCPVSWLNDSRHDRRDLRIRSGRRTMGGSAAHLRPVHRLRPPLFILRHAGSGQGGGAAAALPGAGHSSVVRPGAGAEPDRSCSTYRSLLTASPTGPVASGPKPHRRRTAAA